MLSFTSNVLAVAIGASFAAGLNVYATVATLGLLSHVHAFELPSALHMLGSWPVIIVCAVLFGIEFFADKIPVFDLIWNALNTFVKVPVATLLSYGAAQHLSPGLQMAVAALGGAIALAAHGSKIAVRTAVTPSPEGFSNIALSLLEDIAAISLTWFATRHPNHCRHRRSYMSGAGNSGYSLSDACVAPVISTSAGSFTADIWKFDLIAGCMRYFSVDFNIPLTCARRTPAYMVRLVPRDTKFFDMFAEMATNLGDGARLLKQTLEDFKDVDARVQQLKDIEHRGDDMTHNILTKLNQTFITPFDREDIYRLASSLDDVLDFIYAAGVRLIMYKITSAPPAASLLAGIVVKQADQLTDALARLGKKHDNVLENCVEINRLENEADGIARAAIAVLFEKEKDPISLIKLKELYEVLETATDKAEDAANVLEGVVLKSA